MKTFVPQLLPLLAAMLPLAGTAGAAFNPAVVAADARWVVHVDLNNLRDSTLGRELTAALVQLQPALEQGGLRPDFQKILATAHTITAYGTNFSGDPAQVDGTLVILGTPELRKIVEAFVLQGSIAEPTKIVEIKGLPFEAYAIDGQVSVAFPKEPVILFSKSQAQLTKAYNVFRGSAPSLTRTSTSLTSMLPAEQGYYLIAASFVPTDATVFGNGGPQARILQMANSGSIALGERGPLTAARVQLVASSADMADKLKRILDGMAAVLSLTQSNDAQLTAFLSSVNVERQDMGVTLSLAYPSERLVEMFHDIQRKATQARAHGGGSDGGGNAGATAEPAPTADLGRIVTTWVADADLPNVGPAPETMTTHTVENVELVTGATITISGRRGGGEHARIDYLEARPMQGGGTPERYEAEYMRLNRYRIEAAAFASGGEIIRLVDGTGTGTASFRFQGASGTYRITIGFVDESDGRSSFAVGVQAPVGASGPEAVSP